MSTGKTLFYCIAGTIMEWYDFAIFGALAPILSKLFFPRQNQTTSLLFVFAVFATAFLMRPIGGIVLGHIGDKYGRKKAVVSSILIMTVASLGLGLLPTPTHFSYIVVILFLTCRLLQGFSVGGEYSGLVIFIGEISRNKRFYFYQGLLNMGTFVGILLGIMIADVASWLYRQGSPQAWRLPFLLSILLGVFGLYLRLKAIESPVFQRVLEYKRTAKLPLKAAMKHFKKKNFVLFAISIPSTIACYYSFIYYPSYLSQLGMPREQALHIGSLALVTAALSVIIVGYFAVHNGMLTLIKTAMIGYLLIPVTMSFVVSHVSLYFAVPAQLIYAVLISLLAPTIPAYIALHFPDRVRYTATSLSFNFCALFGGIAPFVSQLLIKITHLPYAPAFYITATAAIGLIAVLSCDKRIFLNDAEITRQINVD